MLLIQGTDLVVNGGDGTVKYNKVSEHNRSEFNINNNRIEESVRMSNGSLRKFYVADKRTFNLSWTMLPSYRTLTVDGAWGAEDLRSFYLSDDGKKEFNIRVNLAKGGTDTSSSGAVYTPTMAKTSSELYTVVFTDCSFTVVKRGFQPHWNVSLTMEEV